MISRLLVPYYRDDRPARRAELDLCIAVNSTVFDIVEVVEEGGTRQKFWDLMDLACHGAAEDELIVIANCDILIPRPAMLEMAHSLKRDEAYCLARHEVGPGGVPKLYDVDFSQDLWAFRGPPRPMGDFFFGLPGCDNRFAHELQQAGYTVTNPSRSIQTIHVHASNLRTETNTRKHRVPPPYLFISPTYLGETPKYRTVTGPKTEREYAQLQG